MNEADSAQREGHYLQACPGCHRAVLVREPTIPLPCPRCRADIQPLDMARWPRVVRSEAVKHQLSVNLILVSAALLVIGHFIVSTFIGPAEGMVWLLFAVVYVVLRAKRAGYRL